MEAALAGLIQVVQPETLIIILGGFTLGYIVGSIPGFNDANLMAILLPLTIYMDSTHAIIGMAALYFAAQTSGSIPAILMNIPGTGGNAATTLDGYPMTRRGEAAFALGTSFGASAVGAIFGAVAALLIAPSLGMFALRFGPAELFMLAAFGLTVVGSVGGGDPLKAALAIFLGILVALIGIHQSTGFERGTYDVTPLFDGIGLIPVILGLFGVPELVALTRRKKIADTNTPAPKNSEIFAGFFAALRRGRILFSSSIIGLVVGIIPGAGASIGSFVSYGFAKRLSDRGDNFGQGEPDGVIASDTANNAVACGAVIPLLTLGLPGSASTTVMLAALMLHGIRPGPQFFTTHEIAAYTILWSFLVAALLIAFIGVPFARLLKGVVNTPAARLAPVTLFLLFVGAYANQFSIFDMGLMVVFGILGILMRAGGFPPAAFLLAFILTPVLETNYQRAARIGGNEIFFNSPISLTLLGLSILSLTIPVVIAIVRRRANRQLEG